METFLPELKTLFEQLPSEIPEKQITLEEINNYHECYCTVNDIDEECPTMEILSNLRYLLYNKNRFKIQAKIANRFIIILDALVGSHNKKI